MGLSGLDPSNRFLEAGVVTPCAPPHPGGHRTLTLSVSPLANCCCVLFLCFPLLRPGFAVMFLCLDGCVCVLGWLCC
jgi:hypothetical protein